MMDSEITANDIQKTKQIFEMANMGKGNKSRHNQVLSLDAASKDDKLADDIGDQHNFHKNQSFTKGQDGKQSGTKVKGEKHKRNNTQVKGVNDFIYQQNVPMPK